MVKGLISDNMMRKRMLKKEWDLYFTSMEKFSKVTLHKIESRARVTKFSQTILTIWGIFTQEKEKEKDHSTGIMAKFTTANGEMAKKKAVGYGKVLMVCHTWENGIMISLKVLGC